MWATFRNLDKWSQQAFTLAAGGSGLTEVASRPVSIPLHSVAIQGGWENRGWDNLRFDRIRNGEWQPSPNGSLSAGRLTIFDTRGRVVAGSEYDGRRWSAPLHGLSQPIYLFVFQPHKGKRLEGKLAARL